MRKILYCIFGFFIPLLLILGFARKSVNVEQKFLPDGKEVLNLLQTCPDFKADITADLNEVNSFWNDTQQIYFSIPNSQSYGDIWSDANKDNWFIKMGATFRLLFDQIGSFFQCFVPFFKMLGSCFKLVGHAIAMPFKAASWLWSGLLGIGTT